MKLGIIARADKTGLGNQTKELVDMLKPDKILLIDSSHFNGNVQYPEWYDGYDVQVSESGFLSNSEIERFLRDIDVVLSCEIFYNHKLTSVARRRGIKTVLQYNYEFFEHFVHDGIRQPTILLGPTTWHIDKMKEWFGGMSKIVHLPPPTNPETFEQAKKINLSKTHKRILHVAGKRAAKDRNGTDAVIEMLKYSKADYELVVTVQGDLNTDCVDPRLTIRNDNPDNRAELYEGFDLMILPRKYGGLCLPMNEALLSAIPVIMTDTSPNNDILPANWLVECFQQGGVRFKGEVELYETNPEKLAELVDNFINNEDLFEAKRNAYSLGYNLFSPDVLKDKYISILE